MANGRARIRRAIREGKLNDRIICGPFLQADGMIEIPPNTPGYEGREAQRANRRKMERWVSKHAHPARRKVVRRVRLRDHWTRKPIHA